MSAVDVAKAALSEAGHVELADMVQPNLLGLPMIHNERAHEDHRPVIAKAFLLAHLALGHPAKASRGLNSRFEWVDSIDCPCVDDPLTWFGVDRDEAPTTTSPATPPAASETGENR